MCPQHLQSVTEHCLIWQIVAQPDWSCNVHVINLSRQRYSFQRWYPLIHDSLDFWHRTENASKDCQRDVGLLRKPAARRWGCTSYESLNNRYDRTFNIDSTISKNFFDVFQLFKSPQIQWLFQGLNFVAEETSTTKFFGRNYFSQSEQTFGHWSRFLMKIIL